VSLLGRALSRYLKGIDRWLARAVKMAGRCASDAEALDLASRFERDTLVLLNEMRAMVGPKDKAVVDEITREEQAHLVTLAEARRNLKG